MSLGLHAMSLIVQFAYFTFHVRIDSCRDCLLFSTNKCSMYICMGMVVQWREMVALGTKRVSEDEE